MELIVFCSHLHAKYPVRAYNASIYVTGCIPEPMLVYSGRIAPAQGSNDVYFGRIVTFFRVLWHFFILPKYTLQSDLLS